MQKTSAFVLKKNNYREYDRVYTMYTSDYGKVSLLVRGARKIKSKLAPNLENFGEVKINFANGKAFNHLAGARTVIKNNSILKDNNKIFLAQDFFYLLDRFVKLGENDARIFSLLRSALDVLDREKDEKNFPKIQAYFFWRLADLLGYRPQLDGCVLCGSIIIGSSKFNVTENIVICDKCKGEGVKISEATLQNLRKIFETALEDFLTYNLDGQLLGITNKARQIKLSEL